MEEAHQPITVTLLHMNDTHSHFEAGNEKLTILDSETLTCTTLGGITRLVTKVHEMNEEREYVLFLHAVDMIQGTLYYTLYNGEADARFYNMVGVHALVAGNHEFDRSSQGIADLYSNAEFPIIAANLDVSDEPLLAYIIQPYQILTVRSEQIGVIGVAIDEQGIVCDYQGNPVLLAGDSFRTNDREDITGKDLAAVQAAIAENPRIEIVEEDPDAVALLQEYSAGVEKFNNTAVGAVTEDLTHARVPDEDMPMGSEIAPVVCDGMLWKAQEMGIDADIAIQNAGGSKN